MNDNSANTVRNLIRQIGHVTEVYEVTEFRAYNHPQYGELTVQLLDAGAESSENRHAVNLLDSNRQVIKSSSPAPDLDIAIREALQ